jgi:arginine deiminase
MSVPDHLACEIRPPKLPAAASLGLVDEVRGYLDSLKPRDLAETLIGACRHDFRDAHGGEMLQLVREAAGMTEYLLPPLHNTLYTRETTR